MTDPRLDALRDAVAEPAASYGPVRISRIKLSNYKFFHGDFQIFFFTHDKELIELYRNKMPWEAYELYLDDTGPIPKAIVKKGSSPVERAKEFYARKEHDGCGLMIRKELERVLRDFLPPKEQLDKNFDELDLAGPLGGSIARSAGEATQLLRKLDSDRKHILNPLSHDDDGNIFSEELKAAIVDLERLKALLK